uniref:hypothetical protein n=1 Tax=uncultured Abyssibacter sp. TaxID=2320202 RepID=UPI0032B119C8
SSTAREELDRMATPEISRQWRCLALYPALVIGLLFGSAAAAPSGEWSGDEIAELFLKVAGKASDGGSAKTTKQDYGLHYTSKLGTHGYEWLYEIPDVPLTLRAVTGLRIKRIDWSQATRSLTFNGLSLYDHRLYDSLQSLDPSLRLDLASDHWSVLGLCPYRDRPKPLANVCLRIKVKRQPDGLAIEGKTVAPPDAYLIHTVDLVLDPPLDNDEVIRHVLQEYREGGRWIRLWSLYNTLEETVPHLLDGTTDDLIVQGQAQFAARYADNFATVSAQEKEDLLFLYKHQIFKENYVDFDDLNTLYRNFLRGVEIKKQRLAPGGFPDLILTSEGRCVSGDCRNGDGTLRIGDWTFTGSFGLGTALVGQLTRPNGDSLAVKAEFSHLTELEGTISGTRMLGVRNKQTSRWDYSFADYPDGLLTGQSDQVALRLEDIQLSFDTRQAGAFLKSLNLELRQFHLFHQHDERYGGYRWEPGKGTDAFGHYYRKKIDQTVLTAIPLFETTITRSNGQLHFEPRGPDGAFRQSGHPEQSFRTVTRLDIPLPEPREETFAKLNHVLTAWASVHRRHYDAMDRRCADLASIDPLSENLNRHMDTFKAFQEQDLERFYAGTPARQLTAQFIEANRNIVQLLGAQRELMKRFQANPQCASEGGFSVDFAELDQATADKMRRLVVSRDAIEGTSPRETMAYLLSHSLIDAEGNASARAGAERDAERRRLEQEQQRLESMLANHERAMNNQGAVGYGAISGNRKPSRLSADQLFETKERLREIEQLLRK